MPEARVQASYEADQRLTIVETELRLHVRQCDQRAAMAQKLLWFGATINVAVLGTLLKLVLKL